MSARDLQERLTLVQKAKKRCLFRTISIPFRFNSSAENRFGELLRQVRSGVRSSRCASFLFGEEIKRQFMFIDFDDAVDLGLTESSSISSAIESGSFGKT